MQLSVPPLDSTTTSFSTAWTGPRLLISGAHNPAATFSLIAFDLSSITGLNNNPNAVFRIIFNGATSSTGNNRLDNLVVEGTSLESAPVPEPASLVLLATGVGDY